MGTVINPAPACFPGLRDAVLPSTTAGLDIEDIEEDVTAEQETLMDPTPTSEEPDGVQPEQATTSRSINAPNFVQLQTTLIEASKGVTEGTDAEYKRLMNACLLFLSGTGLLSPNEEIFSKKPRTDMPWLIVAWIMNVCDSLNLDGTKKPSSQEQGTYGHAQKMRASMTYAFGKLNGLGNMPWHESDAGGSIMFGNPSISVEVSSFMCSLRRRKVQAGEVANSARAITPEILMKLYHHNHLPQNWTVHAYQPGSRKLPTGGGPSSGGESSLVYWGGGRARRLLQAAYTVAFLCMLRFDEVLKIQAHDLCVYENGIVLKLPFRKTHQNGEIKPFHLWAFPPDEAHLCPVRALAAWLCVSGIESGYIFRKIHSGDRIAEANSPMSSEQFLELFRNNLLDINIDPAPYGTHSFRRGGCQYLHIKRRWPLRKICEWGGWSAEFTNVTIVKYLISSNDDPAEAREDFFNPNLRPTVKCPQCGRCCACA